jgi:hypothetical protein
MTEHAAVIDRPAPGRKSSRTIERAGPALAEPVKVAEFWKNRKGESIRAQLVTYQGINCFDLRQHFTGHDGRMQPTKKGICIAVLRLPELATAVSRALAKAIELGLIEAEAD